jgi:hypothetical protein
MVIPPCGALDNWIYDCREINDDIGRLETQADIDYCQNHYTAVRGRRGSKISEDTVFCEAQNGQCMPGPDVCNLSRPPFELQTSIFNDPNGPKKCEDLPIGSCPFFSGTGESSRRNCIVDFPRLPSGESIGGVPKICRNADLDTEPRWSVGRAMAALNYRKNTCDAKGFWGTHDDCQEICDLDDNEGIGIDLYNYDCTIGSGKYCMCDSRRGR